MARKPKKRSEVTGHRSKGAKKPPRPAFHCNKTGGDPAAAKRRICLACDKPFASAHAGNRICPRCRARQEVAADRPAVRIGHPGSHRGSYGPPGDTD